MVFSSVQRLSPEKFEDFQGFLKKKSTYNRLVNKGTLAEIQQEIEAICKEYNQKHGMKRKIIDFCQKYVSDEDKALINSKIFKPASYKPDRGRTREDGFELILDLLLRQRNDLDHNAIYTPFHDSSRPSYTHKLKLKDGKKEIEFTSNLTFQEFYEAIRKATAKFWLEEYETYLKDGGKKIIDKLVEEVTEQCERINKEAKNKK